MEYFQFQEGWMTWDLIFDLRKVHARFYNTSKKIFYQETARTFFLTYLPNWFILILFILTIVQKLSLWHVLTILLPIVICSELLQFLMFPKRHFKFLENWVEAAIIILSMVPYIAQFFNLSESIKLFKIENQNMDQKRQTKATKDIQEY